MTESFEEAQRELREAQRRKENMKKQRVILTLKNGDGARIRFLRPIESLVNAKKHDYFDRANPDDSIHAMCAESYGKVCYWCAAWKNRNNSDLKPSKVYIYPVWVYDVQNPDLDDSKKKFYDEMGGYHLLVLSSGSYSHSALMAYHADEGSITGCDWRYARNGSGLESKYTLTPKAPSSFAIDGAPSPDADDILYQINEAFPLRMADGSMVSAPFVSTNERPF